MVQVGLKLAHKFALKYNQPVFCVFYNDTGIYRAADGLGSIPMRSSWFTLAFLVIIWICPLMVGGLDVLCAYKSANLTTPSGYMYIGFLEQ